MAIAIINHVGFFWGEDFQSGFVLAFLAERRKIQISAINRIIE